MEFDAFIAGSYAASSSSCNFFGLLLSGFLFWDVVVLLIFFKKSCVFLCLFLERLLNLEDLQVYTVNMSI